jgi:sugar/nucleoside kinase (ribokinase family)
VSADLAVATPVYVDLTFVGLEALPEPGQECFAGDLMRSPGGGAITAIAAARLGLDTVLVAPLADDEGGRFVRALLTEEGITVGPARGQRTATTVVMPVGGDPAMVTVDPGVRASTAEIAAPAPRAVVANLELLDLIPPAARAYITVGDDDARAYSRRLPQRDPPARAMVLNWREAQLLTGARSAAEAAEALAPVADNVVVGTGTIGATAFLEGRSVSVPGVDVDRTVDPTGDRDLLVTALAWADLHGADPEAGLCWALLYAALGSTVPTATAGAVTRERLLREGRHRGLTVPPALAV